MRPLSALFLVACLLGVVQSQTLLDVVSRTPNLFQVTRLLRMPANAQVANILSNPNTRVTFFCPSDAAIQAAQINPNQGSLVRDTLLYHILPSRVATSDINSLVFKPTLLQDPSTVNLGGAPQSMQLFKTEGGPLRIFNGPTGDTSRMATVVSGDISASNGVLHVIDKTLFFPRSASETAQRAGVERMINELRKENLLDTAENNAGITIIAPSDSVSNIFMDFFLFAICVCVCVCLQVVLLSHFAPFLACTFYFHECALPLFFSSFFYYYSVPVSVSAVPNTTFASDLSQAFQRFSDFVHSPRGKAANINLNQVLRFHLIPRVLTSLDLDRMASEGGQIQTLQGGSVKVSREQGRISLGSAPLTRANVLIRNGIIHVIDRVLPPP